jgi:hypothetical protein
MFYICAIYDDKRGGTFPQLYTDDPQQLERFAKEWDRPGMSVYQCVSALQPGAQRRCLDTVAETPAIHIDVDTRTLLTPADTVKQRLIDMSATLPFEVRDSGGGLHVLIHLKEPVEAGTAEFDRVNIIRKALTEMLCGDPAPAHAAALLRRVGTHNSKYGEPRMCQTIKPGKPADITDVEAFIELYGGQPQFERKPKPNDHSPVNNVAHNDEEVIECARVDVKAELAAIRPGTCNEIQIRVVPALVNRGLDLDEIHKIVLDATIRGVHPEWAHKTRDQLASELRSRMLSTMRNLFTNKFDPTTGAIPPWLHSSYHPKWIEVLKAGGRPMFSYNRFGFCVRPMQEYTASVESPSIAPEGGTPFGSPEAEPKIDPKVEPPRPSKPGLFTLPRLEPFNFTELEGFDILYANHYMRGVVTGTVAPGGSGKSSNSMVEGVAMSSGRNLLGEVPAERVRVWYHGGEDSMKILRLRLAAICIHYKIPIEELCGWFFMTSGTEFPLRVATEGYTKLDINHVLLDRIGDEIERNEIGCVIFDPFVKMHRTSEQDNSRIDQIASEFGALADKYQCAVDLVHHTRKMPAGAGGRELNVDDTRGAGALKDALRSVRMLGPIAGNDAIGIPEAERHRYFQIGLVKANHTIRSDVKQLYRFHTVTIPNLQQSEVGVVTAWQGQRGGGAEFTENMRRAEAVFMTILNRLTLIGARISDRKGVNYAPRIFSQEPEAVTAKMGVETLAGAMGRLLRAGRIQVREVGPAHKTVHTIVPAEEVENAPTQPEDV